MLPAQSMYLGTGEVLGPESTELFFEELPSTDLRRDVDELLDSIHNHEVKLATNYVKLGHLLLRVRANRNWVEWGFRSWGSYIDSLRERINRARSQIYQVIGVVEKLTPMIEAEVLEQMGISKAAELKRFVSTSGRAVNHRLLEIASDSSKGIEELRAACFEEMHAEQMPRGKYFDLSGFFCSSDERKEIEYGFALARQVDPIIAADTPEPQAKLEIMLRLVREFVSTWGAILEEERKS